MDKKQLKEILIEQLQSDIENMLDVNEQLREEVQEAMNKVIKNSSLIYTRLTQLKNMLEE